jgi:hypothetical protein
LFDDALMAAGGTTSEQVERNVSADIERDQTN